MVSPKTCANAIRALSIDAVEKARSGHPGMPMGMADIAEVLWREFLNHNPQNPHWMNRDRFVLSNGHGCMLLYSVLHLTGYDLSIDDIKQFRQLHSKTPGHPEFGHTPGVEATAGPLGQGIAMAVGMAIAEKNLHASFDGLIDHHTYVFAGDGCLMEGVSHEACSLAGTLQLGKLIVFYDDNGISIDGEVEGWFTDNTPERFRAYHWQVIDNVDGHDREAIQKAIIAAKADIQKPTLIVCKTKIGFGAPNMAGTEKVHGSPLGDVESKLAKENLGWHYAPFEIPSDIYQAWDAKVAGAEKERAWGKLFSDYKKSHPEKALELLRRVNHALPVNFQTHAKTFFEKIQTEEQKPAATRKLSEHCINYFSEILPEFLGGSADLTGSNNTKAKTTKEFSVKNPTGDYLHYGVREFGMAAMMNGLALHGGFLPFGGTFLTFADYCKNAVRMSALMQQKVIYVFTHDSLGLGEDGPTHQPVEQATMLRIIPNMHVWRPCDLLETAVAWQQAIEYKGPSALLLTRQNLQPQAHASYEDIMRGGYILFEPQGVPTSIIIATGSEVQLAVEAAKKLEQSHQFVRVVSMPCCEIFKKQDAAYQEKILPRKIIKRLAIEAGVPDYWYQFVGLDGKVLGVNTFGASAPEKEVWQAFGFTVEKIVERMRQYASASE